MLPVSICIIAKNEEKNLSQCLPAIKNCIGGHENEYEILVVDTGSSDNTITIAMQYGCKIEHFIWCDDFSAARNYAISVATYDTILFLDADEIPEEIDWSSLQKELMTYPTAVGCFLRRNLCPSGSSTTIYADRVERLFNRNYYHYECRIHEQLTSNNHNDLEVYNIPFTVYHEGYMGTPEQLATKAKRNNDLLFMELAEAPDDPYLYFQIAQSFGLMNDIEKQYDYYVQAYQLHPDKACSYYPSMIVSLGHAMLSLQKYDEALQLLAEEYDFLSSYADFLCFGGNLYTNVGMLLEAIDIYKQALKTLHFSIEGMNSDIPHYNLGCIYEALGNEAMAIQEFSMASNHKEARFRLASLQEKFTEEEINYKKISVIIPINASADIDSLLSSLENQTIGICHLEIIFAISKFNQAQSGNFHAEDIMSQITSFEQKYPLSVMIINIDDLCDCDQLISIAYDYISADYFSVLTPNSHIHLDAFRQLRLALIQEECDFVTCCVNFNELDNFVIQLNSDQTRREIITSNLLGAPLQHSLYSNSFIQKNNLTMNEIIHNQAINYANSILCLREELL